MDAVLLTVRERIVEGIVGMMLGLVSNEIDRDDVWIVAIAKWDEDAAL